MKSYTTTQLRRVLTADVVLDSMVVPFSCPSPVHEMVVGREGGCYVCGNSGIVLIRLDPLETGDFLATGMVNVTAIKSNVGKDVVDLA